VTEKVKSTQSEPKGNMSALQLLTF